MTWPIALVLVAAILALPMLVVIGVVVWLLWRVMRDEP
jgi:hypothetical protein